MSEKCDVCRREIIDSDVSGRPGSMCFVGSPWAPTADQESEHWRLGYERVTAEIAAAEERGRRSAETEQADLLLECEEALVWCSAADAFSPDGIAVKGWQRIVVPVLERIRAVRKDLAPRDSAPACDAVLSSDPFREWRCGKPKDHEGPHSGDRK